MDLQQEFQTMLDEFEYDDDVFYSELKRQVLQLTAEDDDEDYQDLHENKNPNMIAAKRQGLYNYKPCNVARDGGYYNWPANREDHAAPAWILNLWRNTGNGTGVFIPQIAQSRRKNRPRRKNNERGKTYKRVEKMN